jgi:hypothetical protein
MIETIKITANSSKCSNLIQKLSNSCLRNEPVYLDGEHGLIGTFAVSSIAHTPSGFIAELIMKEGNDENIQRAFV